MTAETTVDAGPKYGAGAGEVGLVSVVIPTYQRAHTIRQAVDSVLAQSYRPVEVIVADDGSTDDTRAQLAGYGPEVRYLHQPNAGVSAARNLGLQAARGEFVALLDSDDIWQPWKLTAQVALLRALPEVGMTWTDMTAINLTDEVVAPTYLRKFYSAYSRVNEQELFSTTGRVFDLCPGLAGVAAETCYRVGNLAESMLLGNLVHTSTVLMRREVLRQVGGFDTVLRYAGEDYDFHLRTCACGPVALLDAPSILYRIGADDQITAPRFTLYFARGNLRTLEAALAKAGERLKLSPRVIERRLADSHSWLGREELRAGNRSEARAQFSRSLAHCPLQASAAALWLLSLLPTPCTRVLRSVVYAIKGLTQPQHAMG